MQKKTHIYEVRCPLHGSIAFNERERRIIDHPYYQRLRSISQLGFTSMVYPGATHTRFNHGLGAMHLAGRIVEQIFSSQEPGALGLTANQLAYCKQVVRFAGLMHDTGHPPFSHAFEPLLPLVSQLPLPTQWYANLDHSRQATHEDYSIAMIHALATQENPLLSLAEAQDISSLIHHEIQPSENLTTPSGVNVSIRNTSLPSVSSA